MNERANERMNVDHIKNDVKITLLATKMDV